MKSIYEMEIIELIKTKDVALNDLSEALLEYKKEEALILLTTDFKELGLTNEKMRTAYVTNALINLKESIELHKNSLNIVNDLIKLRLQEVK